MNDHDRIAALERRAEQLETIIAAVQKDVARIANDTDQIVSLWNEARSAFKLFNTLATLARAFVTWVVLPVALVCAALYAWKTGAPPQWLSILMRALE
jgi:type IV secretory pathway TrbL component